MTGTSAQALSDLRPLPAEKIVSVPTTIGILERRSSSGERAFRFGPVVDGYILPKPPGEVWAAGEMLRMPLIAGSLLDDGWVFSRGNPIKALVGYKLVLRMLFGSEFNRALELFPAKNDQDVPAAVERLTSLLAFRAPARRLVRWMDSAGGDSWLYHFSRNPQIGQTASNGVIHGLEIPYVFNNLGAIDNATDKAISRAMIQCWISFAREGDPNGKEGQPRISPIWPKYQKETDRHLEFANEIRVETGLDRDTCDFLDRTMQNRGIR